MSALFEIQHDPIDAQFGSGLRLHFLYKISPISFGELPWYGFILLSL